MHRPLAPRRWTTTKRRRGGRAARPSVGLHRHLRGAAELGQPTQARATARRAVAVLAPAPRSARGPGPSSCRTGPRRTAQMVDPSAAPARCGTSVSSASSSTVRRCGPPAARYRRAPGPDAPRQLAESERSPADVAPECSGPTTRWRPARGPGRPRGAGALRSTWTPPAPGAEGGVDSERESGEGRGEPSGVDDAGGPGHDQGRVVPATPAVGPAARRPGDGRHGVPVERGGAEVTERRCLLSKLVADCPRCGAGYIAFDLRITTPVFRDGQHALEASGTTGSGAHSIVVISERGSRFSACVSTVGTGRFLNCSQYGRADRGPTPDRRPSQH